MRPPWRSGPEANEGARSIRQQLDGGRGRYIKEAAGWLSSTLLVRLQGRCRLGVSGVRSKWAWAVVGAVSCRHPETSLLQPYLTMMGASLCAREMTSSAPAPGCTFSPRACSDTYTHSEARSIGCRHFLQK